MTAPRALPPVAHRMPPCGGCRHWTPRFGDYRICEAFPAGIPDVIWLRFRQHVRPVAGDHGIRFEPLAPVAAAAPEEV